MSLYPLAAAAAVSLLSFVLVLRPTATEPVSYYDVRPEGMHLYDPHKAAELHRYYVKRLQEKKSHVDGLQEQNSSPDKATKLLKAQEGEPEDVRMPDRRQKPHFVGSQTGLEPQQLNSKSTGLDDPIQRSLEKLISHINAQDVKRSIEEGMRD
eukprot:jgi/Botrbrau1/17485/Bobra.0054s0068.1